MTTGMHLMSQSVHYPNNRARWTLEHLRFLETQYGLMRLVDIAARLGRTPGAVALMADKLCCRRRRNVQWTTAELDIIRLHYARGDGAEYIATLLPGRTVAAIFTMAEKMDVLSGRFWREEELQILARHYPVEGTAVTRLLPGRNVVAVRVMAKRQGLKKSRESQSGFRLWSDDEWRLLEGSMHLSVAEQQQTLFPDRTYRAVQKARERLKRRRK